jgi:hypothetical protein
MDPVKMKAPMPQMSSQSANHPDVDEDDATEHEFTETLNTEVADTGSDSGSDTEEVVAPKGKRRRRAASSGVITA